jgi:GT2 family glycosyltransferase
MNKVFICVPTFKEPKKAKLFLESLSNVAYPLLEVIIINANAPDETSDVLNLRSNSNYEITELLGSKEEYWSASLNRGLRYVKTKMSANDWVILMNIDVEFSTDVVTELVNCAESFGNCQVGAMAVSNGVAISSGVSVKSWALTLNKHPYAGFELSNLPGDIFPVDFLPGRCFIFPSRYLVIAGLIDEKSLPHYHADYEFSYRLKRSGCKTLLNSGVIINADMSNTGFSVFDNKTNLFDRFSDLWSIKNPSNPYYRVMMVLRMFPFYFIPNGILFYLGRSFIEVFFGNRVISLFLNKKEQGYSGSNNIQKN